MIYTFVHKFMCEGKSNYQESASSSVDIYWYKL